MLCTPYSRSYVKRLVERTVGLKTLYGIFSAALAQTIPEPSRLEPLPVSKKARMSRKGGGRLYLTINILFMRNPALTLASITAGNSV